VRKLALAAFCDGVVLRALGEICVQVGRSFYLIRKWHHAATAFKAALSLHASSAEWHYQLGRARERLELWEKAASAYEAALALDDSRAKWHNQLGRAWEKTGRWEQAAAAYKAALARDDSRAEWHHKLGRALEKSGHWEGAAAAYEAALGRDNTPAEWHYQLGRMQERSGRWEEAAAAYDAALARAPLGALAQDGITRACRRAKQLMPSVRPSLVKEESHFTVCFSPAPSVSTTNLASARIRCTFMAKALNDHFGDLLLSRIGIDRRADTIVVSQTCSTKTLIELATAKAEGTLIIYDCCDPYADYEGCLYGVHAARRFWDLVALANAITVPTENMRSLLRELEIEKSISVLPDTIDYQEQTNPELVPPNRSVIWFGNPGRGNFTAAAWALQALKERWSHEVTLITNPMKISAPSDFHVEPWAYDGFVGRLRQHGLALISQDPRASYKSENRYVVSIVNGIPAISTGSESIYRLLKQSGFAEMSVTSDYDLDKAMELLSDPIYRSNYVSRMQLIVQDRFGPLAVGRHFVEEILQRGLGVRLKSVAPAALKTSLV